MIGNDQELGRVGERDVVGEDLRFDMPVHADQREILRLAVDLPGDASLLCRERESPVGMSFEMVINDSSVDGLAEAAVSVMRVF